MDDTAASGRVTSAAVQEAHTRDRQARNRLGLKQRDEVPPTYVRRTSQVRSQHGDVGPTGDLVDALRPSRILSRRAGRLAACITAATPAIAASQLENILNALERVPS